MHTVLVVVTSQHPTALSQKHILLHLHPPALHCTAAPLALAIWLCSTLLLSTHINADTLCQHQSIHPSIDRPRTYRSHQTTMRQRTTANSTITNMADSVTPQTSWIPLLQPSLSNQVIRKYGYVPPDSNCSIIYGPQVSFQCLANMNDF